MPDVTELPSFSRPPVAEVVLAVAFGGATVTAAHLGAFWAESLQQEFPVIEDQPPYDPPIESFEIPPNEVSGLSVLTGPAPTRIWAKSRPGTQLVQLQQGWFACNWRDAGGEEPYPRYPAVEEFFLKNFRAFQSYVKSHDLGEVRVTSCEVTYVNHIRASNVWSSHEEMDRAIRLLAAPAFDFLPRPAQHQLASQFLIQHDGKPVGRLHVTIQPAWRREDRSPAILLNLTARGAPLGEGENGVLAFLRLGREWVVRGFADVTTSDEHSVWGRST